MSTLRKRPRRLLLSLYLVGVIQLAVVATAIVLAQRLLERAPWQYEPARQKSVLEGFAEFYDTPEALSRALGKLHDIDLTYYRLDGSIVASTDPPLALLTPPEIERLREAGMIFLPTQGPIPITAVPISRGGAIVGYGLVHRRPPQHTQGRSINLTTPDGSTRPGIVPPNAPGGPPLWPTPSRLPIVIAIALLGVAVTSFLFSRSLLGPLQRLANAASAFGAGDLSARASIDRDDELGTVAQTFDEMAERVNGLLRMQREFLANVSHELRTPLARIRVALDIASEGDLEAARQSLREIALDWGDLDRLVEDVLAVARFDLAQDPTVPAVELRYEAIDATSLLERAATAFRGVNPGRKLEIDSEEVTGPVPFYGDQAMLRRVLDNLLNNAAAYSETDTTVRVRLHQSGDHVEVAVEDRGIGIEPADLQRLFVPFFRTDRSRARKTGGVGLGLALARRIVEAHHGELRVESRVGVGTTMTVRLPIEPRGTDRPNAN